MSSGSETSVFVGVGVGATGARGDSREVQPIDEALQKLADTWEEVQKFLRLSTEASPQQLYLCRDLLKDGGAGLYTRPRLGDMATVLDGPESTERTRAEEGLRHLEVTAEAGDVGAFLGVCSEICVQIHINTAHPALASNAAWTGPLLLGRTMPRRVQGLSRAFLHVTVTLILARFPDARALMVLSFGEVCDAGAGRHHVVCSGEGNKVGMFAAHHIRTVPGGLSAVTNNFEGLNLLDAAGLTAERQHRANRHLPAVGDAVGGGAVKKEKVDISNERTLIGLCRRAYVITTGEKKGQVNVGGKPTLFRYRDVRNPGSQKRILGLRQFDNHGSDKT
eukprot:g11475.t1